MIKFHQSWEIFQSSSIDERVNTTYDEYRLSAIDFSHKRFIKEYIPDTLQKEMFLSFLAKLDTNLNIIAASLGYLDLNLMDFDQDYRIHSIGTYLDKQYSFIKMTLSRS